MTPTYSFLSIGECMIEMSGGGETGLWRMGFAGDTLNTLWYAKAGLDPKDGPVAYLTALGTDGFSDKILAFLEENGIATDLIRRVSDRRPGLYMIEQRDGDRRFTYWRETSAARCLADDPDHLDKALDAARLVYFSGITLAILPPPKRADLIDRLTRARAAGKIVAYDPNIRPVLWEDERTLADTIMRGAGAASIVLPSFDDEARAFGDGTPADTVERYRAAGAELVAVKNGGAPVLVDSGTDRSEIATQSDVAVVDATGAGDSFNGAFLAAFLNGASAADAARAGCATAARVVATQGALIRPAS
ncbi:sugar kinase [Fulvimarina sp. 2208YS6-2-32]|uniref:Sugar kinase n=1 Tax=Fulvimarina uroteuthidis TaxID=3098149 RepID=A0ABU5I5V9_9HYPH|nr:sugar kinase [Fulvimarina sp. 2208YS6-2-32]MDY8110199.1 sugar kinase [Fulvimarina sp. 2208YS6-2-32]